MIPLLVNFTAPLIFILTSIVVGVFCISPFQDLGEGWSLYQGFALRYCIAALRAFVFIKLNGEANHVGVPTGRNITAKGKALITEFSPPIQPCRAK